MDKERNVIQMHRFIHSIIRRNSVNAALQHAGVYKEHTPQKIRKGFTNSAKVWLVRFADNYQRDNETPESWQKTINRLIQHLSDEFRPHLEGGRVRIGVAQKMISLYLKHRWLIADDDTKKPLFAVVDRVIMKKAKIRNMPNWTQLNDMNEYMRIVREIDEFARSQIKPNQPGEYYTDGASWESDVWTEADVDEDK